MRRSRLLALLTTLIAAAPAATAAPFDTIAESMGLMWNALGSMFSFEFVSGNPAVQLGILKFFLFIVILRVVQVSLTRFGRGGQGLFDNKTAGIIGFAVAGITILFTPNTWMLAGLVAVLVPVIVIGGLIYWAIMGLTGNWLKNLFGVFVLFITAWITTFTIDLFKNPTLWSDQAVVMGNQAITDFTILVLEFTLAFIFILIVIKILSMFGGDGGLLGDWRPWGGGDDPGRRGRDRGGRDRGDGGGSVTPENDPELQNAEPGRADSMDYDRPAQVSFRVVNEDGNPIGGAYVVVMGLDRDRRTFWGGWFTGRRRRHAIIYNGHTDTDGYTPHRGEPASLPSGSVRVRAYHRGAVEEIERDLRPYAETGEVERVTVVMQRRDTPAEGFEPRILEIRRDGDELVLRGVIDVRGDAQ